MAEFLPEDWFIDLLQRTWLIDWLSDCLTNQQTDYYYYWLTDRLTDWLTDLLVTDWLID